MAAIHDNRLLDMMDETITYKKHNSGKKRRNNTDAELIYKLIEEKLNESKQNGA